MKRWSRKTRVLVFGTGAGGINCYRQHSGRYNIVGFLDNDKQKQGKRLFGTKIFAPAELPHLRYDKILIASDYYLEIHEQLVSSLNIDDNIINIFHAGAAIPWFKRIKQTFLFALYDRLCKKRDVLSDAIFPFIFGKASGIKRMNLAWLDTCEAYRVHRFREPMQGSVQPPRVLGVHTPPKRLLIPEVSLYRFNKATVYSTSRSVQLPDGVLVVERVTTTATPTADYCAGPVIYHGEHLALVRPSESAEHIPKGIIINGVNELNYYHWVAETLTQLQFIRELPQPFSNYPLLISERSQKIPAIRFMLDGLTEGHDIVFLKSMTAYNVDDLLMISAAVNLVPNYRGPVVGCAENSFARPESIHFLRQTITHLTSSHPPRKMPTRILLARKDYLRKYNQRELITLLEPYGFEPVYMDDLDIADQISVIANAELIMGPTGAAWTNLIFASPGTRALCWMPMEFGETACFSNIADINGVEMDYILYPAGTSNSRALYFHDYTLDLKPIHEWVASKTSNPV
ncbi:glycosyltransferase family 61 protein [Pseudomonas sp. NPDC088368]|jgi:capsular polysaccharide biosynthesis protein|uniref:glycosyltransferase family 61 protein n=1 Tax=Pseudomonas sp. NPDC088368 TaxID=3364453 RepID=UPI003802E8F1